MGEARPCGVHDTGFTTLYEPTDDALVVADIVLVHGLQGNPWRTWAYKASEVLHRGSTLESASGTQKKSKRKGFRATVAKLTGVRSSTLPRQEAYRENDAEDSEAGAEDEVTYWPKDLLPADCPNARILVWGYDSVVTKGYAPVNKSNMFAHAKDLLYSLDREKPKGRNVVFVAHSLGGLLVKEVLRRSQHAEEASLRDIIETTKAVIFLGTPHRGSAEFAGLGELARSVASAVIRVDSNATVIRALGIDSPELELSRESFLQQWRTYGFQVKTFQESQGLAGIRIGILNDKIVPDISSSLDDPREHAETIQSDHRNMAKFRGRDDPNYAKMRGELKRIMSLLSDGVPTPNLSDQEQGCLKTLAFSVMANRQQNIREALAKTCDWFQDSDIFKAWYARQNAELDHGLLWVKGKPGAGKSTLMKNAVLRTEQAQRPHATVAAFYFNARGSDLEKTPLGLFRSILHQICLQDRGVLAEFLNLYDECRRTAPHGEVWSWSLYDLETFIRRVFRQCKPRRTFIFVDALDECDDQTVREVVYLFAEIAKSAAENSLILNICLSSRHYPTISIPNCPEIVVEGGNELDITAYIRAKFSFTPASEASVVEELESSIIQKASGVFLWVVFVVELLLRDIDAGQPMSKLMQQLKHVPVSMEELYTGLCRSLTTEEQPFSVALVQGVLFGLQFLVEGEDDIQFAVLAAFLSSSPKSLIGSLSDWDYTKVFILPPNERTIRLIKSSSRGLIEYTGDRLQFIHETAREFFLEGPGLGILSPKFVENPKGMSYMALLTGCIDVLEHLHPDHLLQNYCFYSIIHYAKSAEECGGSSLALLDRMDAEGSSLRKPFGPTADSTIVFMSRQNLTCCVRACLERGAHPDGTGSSIETPLLASLDQNSPPDRNLVAALLEYGANMESTNADGRTPLLITLVRQWPELALLLLENGANVNAIDNKGRGVFHFLFYRICTTWTSGVTDVSPPCNVDLLGALRAHGADPNFASSDGWTPLHMVVVSGDIKCVKILLKHGAMADAKNEDGQSPLHLALDSQSEPLVAEICGILLDHGSDPFYKDMNGQTPLHYATRNGSVGTVRRLVKAGVGLDTRGRSGKTPLHMAAKRAMYTGDFEMLAMLVEAGCAKTTRDDAGRTPLRLVMDRCKMNRIPLNPRVMELLTEDGEDEAALHGRSV